MSSSKISERFSEDEETNEDFKERICKIRHYKNILIAISILCVMLSIIIPLGVLYESKGELSRLLYI